MDRRSDFKAPPLIRLPDYRSGLLRRMARDGQRDGYEAHSGANLRRVLALQAFNQ
jgi:hypothetical protein